MTIRLKLLLAGSWKDIFSKWGAELRAKTLVEAKDFVTGRWDPEYAVAAGNTIDSIETKSAYFVFNKVTKEVCFNVVTDITLGGAGTPYIEISMPPPYPVAPVGDGTDAARSAPNFSANVFDVTWLSGWANMISTNRGYMQVGKYNTSNYTVAGALQLLVSGKYLTV